MDCRLSITDWEKTQPGAKCGLLTVDWAGILPIEHDGWCMHGMVILHGKYHLVKLHMCCHPKMAPPGGKGCDCFTNLRFLFSHGVLISKIAKL